MGKNTGFKNERDFIHVLDGKRISDLDNTNLKLFIMDLFPKAKQNSIIKCQTAKNVKVRTKNGLRNINPKQDIIIEVDTDKKYISIKEGVNNSIHQEPLEVFKEFLISQCDATNSEIIALTKFHWGDGTLDGSGAIEDRLKGKDIKKEYSNEMNIVQELFNRNKEKILKRILIEGAYSDAISKVDYFYHGTPEKGVWCNSYFPIEVNLLKENELNPISVGLVTFQNQNRNTTGNPRKENARKDIQFKWSSMEAVIEKHMETSKRLKMSMSLKLRGDNSHGFENQEMIFNALNGNSISKLRNNNLKQFIKKIFGKVDNDAIIVCSKIENNREKGSFDITIGKITKRILIKTGKQNSVHQEAFQEFYSFLENNLNAPQKIINSFKLLQWGDGTLDGKTEKSKWLKMNELKKIYKNEITELQNYINHPKVAMKLLRRFLLEGSENTSGQLVDYYYYGDVNDGMWASSQNILDFELKKLKGALGNNNISIGDIGLQNWGRTVKNGKMDMREQMQIKFTKLKQIISEISKNDSNYQLTKSQGNSSEISFVRRVNQQDQSIMHKFKGISDNIYAVNVDTQQYSELSGSKTIPKSDAYLIKVSESIDEQILFENSYVLTEKMLSKINYERIDFSGVSIKDEKSKSFTYLKASQNSFNSLIKDDGKIFVPLLFFVKTTKDLYKNEEMLSKFNLTLEDIATYLNVNLEDSELENYSKLKKVATHKLRDIIESNQEVYDKVFFGTDVFKEPYAATYFYQTELLHKDELRKLPFSITTGSGRSKGKYTVVIKPR